MIEHAAGVGRSLRWRYSSPPLLRQAVGLAEWLAAAEAVADSQKMLESALRQLREELAAIRNF